MSVVPCLGFEQAAVRALSNHRPLKRRNVDISLSTALDVVEDPTWRLRVLGRLYSNSQGQQTD
jgi:hypothetical protein